MGLSKMNEFERIARAWALKTGASVWICREGDGAFVRVDNPPKGSVFAHGQHITPEAFFAAIGGKFAEPKQVVPTAPPAPRFSVQDARDAYTEYKATCGDTAIAAALGLTLDQVRPLIGARSETGGIGVAAMEVAIEHEGWSTRQIGAQYPGHGVAIVQFGPGDKYRGHWIAVSHGRILDTYSAGWCDAKSWERKFPRRIAKYWPGTDGTWWLALGIEISA